MYSAQSFQTILQQVFEPVFVIVSIQAAQAGVT
jgi:hypothetical protein